MPNETVETTTTQPTEVVATTETPATTLLATATSEAGKQTDPTQTQTQPATEAAAKETTTTTEKPAEAGETKPPEVPEKYEFKAPEGTTYDPGILESFTAAAKEAKLTQDAAQTLIEKMAPALAARQNDQLQAIHNEWTEASRADKEFGGEKLKENLGVAKKALDVFDAIPAGAKTTPLRTLLETTGLANHPEMIRLLYRAGKAVSEDTIVVGSVSGKSTPNPQAVLYDKTPSA